MNLVSLLPIKFKKKCQRFLFCFLGKIKLSNLFVVVGLNKVFPIIARTERKMPGRSMSSKKGIDIQDKQKR